MPFSYDINPNDSSRIRRRSQRIETENSERIEYKALGANLGQLARGAVAFDPNAEDGDGDGLVQDNTPYERPAALSNIADTVRQGLASATGYQTYFTNGKSPTVGMTNREVAEYAVPDNPLQFLEMRLQQQAIQGLPNNNPLIQEDLEKVSFDPEGIEQLRNLVERTLDERPALRVAWDRFGVPPIGISEGKNNYAGVFLSDSILMDDDSLKAKPIRSAMSNARIANLFSGVSGAPRIKGVKRVFVSTDARDTLTHEWGHYLHQLTSRLHPDANIREAATLLDMYWWSDAGYQSQYLDRHPTIKRLFDYFNQAPPFSGERIDLPDDSLPFVSSNYGTTKPGEFVAEAISAYFSPDKKTRELLNDAGVELVEKTFLGIRGGLASTSSGRRTTTGNSMRGLTPAEMAERIVPSTPEEALLSIADHQRMMAIDGEDVNTEALKVAIPRGMNDIDFSPEAVTEMRQVITKALAENRMFREVAERHGFPPVLATKRGAEWVDGDGTYAISMIEGFPSIIVNRDSRNQIILAGGAPNGVYEEEGMLEGTDTFLVSPTENAMIAHEWGHYINRLAASSHPDEDIRALATFWFSDTWDHDAGLTGPWKVLDKLGVNVGNDKASQRIIGARRFAEKVKNKKSEKWTGYPHVLSQYGQTMPAEAFAEGVSAILVGDESSRGLVSPALRDDIFDIIGKPESYQRDIAGGISERTAGLASLSMPRDIFGTIYVPRDMSLPEVKSTPLGGRDWLKDATNDEIADAIAVRSEEDFINLTLMNMMFGADIKNLSPQLEQTIRGVIAYNFFNQGRSVAEGGGELGIDFTPQGIDRTRRIIQSALDASPTFAWIVRNFGSVPIVSVDPDEIDMLMAIRPQDVSRDVANKGIMGWSTGMYGILLNTSSKYGRRELPIGQRKRFTTAAGENGNAEEFLVNVDGSMEGTLYHEWFHSFFGRITGWHSNYERVMGKLTGVPGERGDRRDYLYPGNPQADDIGLLVKDMFDRYNFIPYAHQSSETPKIIDRALQKISANGDDPADFNLIMSTHDSRTFIPELWIPETSQETLDEIQARYPYLVEDLAPLINVRYGTVTRQEQFAEGGALFVTPDTRQRSVYLPPELESIYAYILGLKSDPSPGDYDKPWERRSGLASVSMRNERSISSLNERVHTGKELFVQAGEAHRRPDAVRQSGGMTDVSINGYKFSIMGELPEFNEAYEAWNDWQENWRMRYISSEIMGLGALSSQTDTRRWQSIANNHLKNGTINEASSSTKEEIQRSAMMALSMMKEIADSPYATDAPLYRSISNVTENDAIARLNVGETLSMPLTSFSPDYASVLGFSKDDDQTTLADAIRERSNVIVKLREGTNIVYSPTTKPTPDTDGREVNMPIEGITAGEFIVKNKTNVNGVDVIEIEQSRVIDPLRGSRATDGRKKVETNKRRIKLNQDMTKSLEKIREKVQAREDAATDDERNKIDDDIAFESKRYGAITRALRTQNDDFDKLDTPRTVGGLASASSLEDRASRHGVSLEAFNDEGYDADDIEWSTNDWSFGKTGQVRAGDVVVVRTRNDGKKEILTIERKSGPFRGALSLPGGLQDEGEDLYDTAEREMLEEVNVSPTDAMDRRILGQVDVKDWDPRFVEGGRIAGIRFDLSEEQSSVVKAGDDAGKFNWVDVEEMSTGKYPIAFGHASWLAEAFADDEVLGPRFAVLAEASRVRNQRLIKKIDEKRREKGVKEFGEMPDPSIPYATTTDGIRTGLASARSGIKDISTSREIVGNATRLMRDNANLFDKDPIYDGYYGRTIDGAWVRDLVDGLKSNQKISHEDAVGMYLVLSAISDSKIYYTPETFSESFSIRMTLNNIRFKVSGNEEHTITLDNVGTERVWLAHRGSDYLGDYDTEEEALKAIQDSIADRTMIGPTKPAGLASTSSNNFSDTKSRYTESLDRNIADASDYLSRLEDALDEWNETGVWKGEDYGVVITPGRPPRNMTREDMLEVNYNPDNFSGAVQSRINELGLELSDMEASRSRLDKQGSSTTPIEAILDDPDVLARIEKRAEEVSAMSRPERSELFRDGEYEYVVHWGADVLEGGVLDPARSRGDETSASTVGNTRRINKVTAMQLVANRDDQKQKLSDLTKIQQEFEETGMVNLSSAENPFGVERLIGSLISRGKDRNANYHGDRAYRPFPDKDDLNEMGIDELTPEMKENIATILERSRNGSEQTLARLDKVADKLIEDDYQYSSTYPAEKLQTANGYGGRYGEEGDSWKNDAPKATRTGIHVFRVRIGEDATRDTGGPDEVHIIGQHTPVASLSVETHQNRGHQPGSAQSTWQGWLAEVVEADKASRRGLASTSERNQSIVARLKESTGWFDSAKDTGSEKIVRDNAGRELSVLKEQVSSIKDLDSNARQSLSDAVSKNGVNSVRNNRPLISTLFGINPKDLKESDGTVFYTGSDWSAPIKIERELAIASGDTEKVARIDDYIDFINNATPEEYAQAVVDASNNFGNSMDRRVKVMMNNPLGLIENGRYLTQHDYDERMGVADAGGVARADVRQLRRNVEENFGIPNIQSGSPEDPYKDLRPASGLIQNESLGRQRESGLQGIYGDDVEVIHPYTIGQPVDDSWTLDRENSYGRSSIILRAELAERSLFTNADSASGNPKAIITSEMLGRDANGLSYGKGVGGMPQMLWNDTVDSGQSMMSPSRADGLFYNEALVAGSFTLDEVQAIVTNPNSFLPKDRQVGLVVRGDGSIVVGAYNGEPFDSDARALVEASKMRRKLKADNDVDLVVADLNSGSNFSVDRVEMFNPAMTATYITEVNPKAFPDVGPADLRAGATPMEALLMQRRIDVQNGKFQTSFSPELEKRLLEAKPEDVASLVEQAKRETLAMIDAELSELRKEATDKKSRSGLASTQLTPTDDIEEAKRTGRPVNMFRPGTLPPKTQAEYDAVLEQQMRNLEEAKELRKRYQEIWDRDPTPPYSDEEKDAIQASNKIRNELLFQFVDLTPLNRIMRDELKELGFDDETETRIRRAISDHLSVYISYFISGQYSQESTLGDEARLQHSVDALDKADIAVAFPKDLLAKLIEDGRFKTQFETKTSRGALHPEGRITGDIAQFGYHPDTAPEMRPVYGYLTSGGTIDRNMLGSIKQYGELQFILKRDSHSRSTYTTHDSLSSGLTPAPMGVPSKDASGKVGETMYAEAQIHGGLSLSDVDYVVVNVGEPDINDWRNNKISQEEFESISGMLANVGIRVVPVRDGEIADTWNGGQAIPEPPVEVVAQSQEPVKVVA